MKDKMLELQPQSAEPRGLQDGDLWFREDLCEYRHRRNGETVTISKDEAMRLYMTPTLKPTGGRNFDGSAPKCRFCGKEISAPTYDMSCGGPQCYAY